MKAMLGRLWQRLLRRVGAAGLVGLALLLLAAALLAWTPGLLREAAELRETAQARQAAWFERTQHQPAPPSLQAQVDRFSARFPTRAQYAEDLKEVFAAARRHAVSLNKGEYQFVSEPNSPFQTCTATFPVRESYADIKQFTADVLRRLPHAAMDDLRLERSDAGADRLDARIRISLTYRAS
jgi:hypothetical protein